MKQKKKYNKFLSIIFYVFAAVIFVTFLYNQQSNTLPIDSQAPLETSFELLGGQESTISQFLIRPLLVINFWATWCPPCRHELPDFQYVSEKFKDQAYFIGLALDSSVSEINKLTELFNITYAVGQINSHESSKWQVNTVPTTYILDSTGRIIWAKSGAISKSALIKTIKNNSIKN